MSSDQNIDTIKAVYAAFGRGDVDAILGAVADDVDWGSDTSATGAPWFGIRNGKQAVAAFFEDLGKAVEVEDFTPLTFGSNDDGDVFAVVRYAARVRETGKVAKMQIHHWFHFTAGKISYYRGTEDTAITLDAFKR